MGCIKNVEIARSNFDLLRDAYGVRKGCVLEVLHTVHTVLHIVHTVHTVPHTVLHTVINN